MHYSFFAQIETTRKEDIYRKKERENINILENSKEITRGRASNYNER